MRKQSKSIVRASLLALSLVLSLPAFSQERAEVLLETTEGNIRIALFNETPQHRDNFLKLVGMQLYDSLLFHRVIKDFMVQSGDLNSKHAKPGALLGTGELDYTTEAEFRLPQLFHRRGAVAAARIMSTRSAALEPVSSTSSGVNCGTMPVWRACRSVLTRLPRGR